jgi:hypothetical protein
MTEHRVLKRSQLMSKVFFGFFRTGNRSDRLTAEIV